MARSRDCRRAARRRPAQEDAGVTRPLSVSPSAAVVVVVVILAVVNVADVRVAHASLAVGPVCAAVLLAIGRAAGLSWQEMGLGAGTWRRGFTWAAAGTGAAAVVLGAAAALPLTRHAFRDTRYRVGYGSALLTALVLIPVGTVLLEEVAFRGVLWGLLRRMRGTATATVVSSLLFGLWHVLPSLGLTRENGAIGSAVGKGRPAQVLTELGTVAFTALAGVVFCELRRRSGSILASAGLHWAANALAVLASAAVWAWGTP
jgi:membrane protease YdiL (CAAX protease family)